MGRGRISNVEKQKQEEQVLIKMFGFIPKTISANDKVAEFKEQIICLKEQIQNCEKEIKAMEEKVLNEKKTDAIQLLQELPNEVIEEIVNSVKEQKKATGSESNK